MITARSFTTSKGQTFDSTLTGAEAIDVLADTDGISRFGQSLAAQYRRKGTLTLNQWPWAHLLATEALAKIEGDLRRETEPDITTDLSPLVRLIENAAAHLKHPKIQIVIAGLTIRLSLAGIRARFPGSVNVTNDVPYGQFNSQFYGRIHTDGRFEQGRSCTSETTDALIRFSEDPAAVAAESGRHTGSCCFCRRTLTTDESLAVGYGPVCAAKFGLPWGDESEDAATAVESWMNATEERPEPSSIDEVAAVIDAWAAPSLERAIGGVA